MFAESLPGIPRHGSLHEIQHLRGDGQSASRQAGYTIPDQGAQPRCLSFRPRAQIVAETAGFEPACRLCRPSVFETAPFSLSGTSPNWSPRQDLNLRPLVPQTSALPGCATRRKTGRGNRIRTCDPLLPKQMLYQTELYPEINYWPKLAPLARVKLATSRFVAVRSVH